MGAGHTRDQASLQGQGFHDRNPLTKKEIYIYMHIYIYICAFLYTYVYIHTYTYYVYVCVYIYIYLCTFFGLMIKGAQKPNK